jgi:hypothetical protein
MSGQAIPLAVMRDGARTVLIIIGDDLRQLPEDLPGRDFTASREGSILRFSSADMPELHLEADAQAEMDIRVGAPVVLAHASAAGLREIAREIRIFWPALATLAE